MKTMMKTMMTTRKQRVSWAHWIVAVIVVLAGGLGLALAASDGDVIRIEVEQHGDDEVEVTVNETIELITLDDLADGESRTFGEGDEQITVRREGDELRVDVESIAIGDLAGTGGEHRTMVWVSADDEELEEHQVKKIFIRKTDQGCEEGRSEAYVYQIGTGSGESDEKTVVVKLDGAGHKLLELKDLEGKDLQAKLIELEKEGLLAHGTGVHKMLMSAHDSVDKALFRCEDGDELLVVPGDAATEDSYISPVSGCVMKRIEESRAKVITVIKETHEEETED